MLAVLCGGLLIGRLGLEVLQLRWRALTPEEQQRLLSIERWQTSLSELMVTVARGHCSGERSRRHRAGRPQARRRQSQQWQALGENRNARLSLRLQSRKPRARNPRAWCIPSPRSISCCKPPAARRDNRPLLPKAP